jgi:hypothetical protein
VQCEVWKNYFLFLDGETHIEMLEKVNRRFPKFTVPTFVKVLNDKCLPFVLGEL